MKLYHVSQDIDIREKEFVPRVPKHRLSMEESITKRICVAPSIREAFEGFSQKISFVNYKMRMFDKVYLAVYEFDTDDYIGPEDLKGKIPDINITQEHWITKNITASPEIIKIKHLQLSGYNKYVNEYYGNALYFVYDNHIVDYEREDTFLFLSRRNLNWCKSKYKETGATFEVLDEKKTHLPKCMFRDSDIHRTKKRYNILNVKVTVPANVSMNFLWSMDSYQNHNSLKKKMIPVF